MRCWDHVIGIVIAARLRTIKIYFYIFPCINVTCRALVSHRSLPTRSDTFGFFLNLGSSQGFHLTDVFFRWAMGDEQNAALLPIESTNPPPSLYHPSTVPLPSLYRPSTVPLPSLYRPSTIPLPLYRPSTIPLPSLYHPSTALYRPSTIPLPSSLSKNPLPQIYRTNYTQISADVQLSQFPHM